MVLSLYYNKLSPPVRAVLLTARALNLKLDLKAVDLPRGQHLKPDYTKMNPLQTVPTLDDNGFILFDSHAICGYLVNQYGKDDSLYPREPKKRAIVDQRLHFDSGTLFPAASAISFPIMRGQVKTISDEKIAAVKEAYRRFNALIGSTNPWVAGDHMTIADFSCVAVISSLNVSVPVDDEYPNAKSWLQRCKDTMQGYEDINEDGIKMLVGALQYMMAKI